jgi:hypothetical protein
VLGKLPVIVVLELPATFRQKNRPEPLVVTAVEQVSLWFVVTLVGVTPRLITQATYA